MTNKFLAAVVSATLLAGAANATTYDFTGLGGNLGTTADFTGAGGPNVTAIAGASGILNGGTATLVQGSGGLGVNGNPDLDPTRIDGSPILSSEFITLTFGWAVRLLGINLTGTDRDDQFDLSINGGAFVNNIQALTTNPLNVNYVTSLTIRASGTLFTDGIVFGNDEFRLAGIQTASVPLPAGFGLLAMGLAGIGAVARRRKMSA